MNQLFSIWKSEKKIRKKTDRVSTSFKTKIFFKKLNKNFKDIFKNEDFKLFLSDLTDIVVIGFIGVSILFSLTGNFKLIHVLSIGGGWFLISTKIIPEIIKLLNAFSIIKIGK